MSRDQYQLPGDPSLPPGVSANDPHINPPDDCPDGEHEWTYTVDTDDTVRWCANCGKIQDEPDPCSICGGVGQHSTTCG